MNRLHNIAATGGQVQATSTGTADVQTTTPPVGALACLISVETTDARLTVDGSTPSATNGNVVQAGQSPAYLPIGAVLKHASAVAGSSLLNVTWLFG
jgi:hypothetical protein